MDATYFDLFVKYKDDEEEIVWERCITWTVLELHLKSLRQINETHIKLFGKSIIEYFRIE